MERVFNFSAGPSMIDESVLQKAAAELVAYPGKGTSVLEMSHRSSMFMDIYNEAVSLFREVMGVPEGYEVLFLQGGATMEFSAIPMNMPAKSHVADYIDTGNFAHIAAEEAKKYTNVNVVASSREENYIRIPDVSKIAFTPDADYVYITTNNTIYGTRYIELPDTGNVPLVADASSNILSQPLPVERFGVLYAGTQKNMGPAG
ncbi:MAG: 3-phosphoserine/phosphohydroxythreonine transaminase, partial [Eubacteriales bacterium]|nr:3-phosphoserine/phosphohydroxythreonine transaminase [Eubacteriales bacterium]